ncbi:MAG: 30S ribosomal protein S17e [Candidatus Woesearchaeota archaeon]|nr:30S ribosomal protein S17e [Candidatus Woesearchaeota archaeon]
MGRIKTQLIKRTSKKLVVDHKQDFKKDFNENKQLVAKYIDVTGKKMKNIIAGYVTRMMKAGERRRRSVRIEEENYGGGDKNDRRQQQHIYRK